MTNDESALERTQRILNEAVKEFGIDALPGVEQALERVGQQIKEADPLFSSIVDSLKNVSSGVSDALADMVTNAKFSFDGLRSVFASFVTQLISKAIELLFINRIINGIFGLAGGSALPTANAPNIGSWFGFGGGGTPALGHPGLRADGGPITAGKPLLGGRRRARTYLP